MIEEAPSPFISDATRQAMGEQAVALAKAVRYQSAGTVEFVVGKDQSFYFLEMNTRLQVEHPVTECITGLDLVEQMIRVAAGEKLPFTQDQIPRHGWAMECRINAEDPFRNFLPSTGRLVRYLPPPVTMEAAQPVPEGGGVRVDTGVYEGGEIPMYYDSMIAKLDRARLRPRRRDPPHARGAERLRDPRRVEQHPVPGRAAGAPEVRRRRLQHRLHRRAYGKGFRAQDVPHDDPDFLVALAAAAYRRYRERAARITGQLPGYEMKIGEEFVAIVKGEAGMHDYVPVSIRADGAISVELRGKTYAITQDWTFSGIRAGGSCNGRPFTAQIERTGMWTHVAHNGRRIDAMVLSARAADLLRVMLFKAPADMSRFLLSPMPGMLVDVAVQPGQKVAAGERLAVIEAMKMENVLFATQDGVVEEMLANKGESLAVDQPILRFA